MLIERAVRLDPSDAGAWATLEYWAEQVGDSAALERAQDALARLP